MTNVMGDFVTKSPKKKKAPEPTAPTGRTQRQQTKPPPSPPPEKPLSSGSIQTVTPPSPKPQPTTPKPPSISKFLAGDDVYQQAVRGGERSLQDFLSEITRREGEAKTSFGQTQESMERNRELQLQQMRDEFASRGLLHSGIFGKERGEFEETFARNQEQAQQQFQSLLADLVAQQQNARREQELAMEMARQQALQRRAAQFDIR